jgi:hypothetical protein
MAYAASLKDAQGIPISQVYVPGASWQALQGAPGSTDGSNNTSTGAIMVIGGAPATDPYFATVFAGGMLRVKEDSAQILQYGFDTTTLDVTNTFKPTVTSGGATGATSQLTCTILQTGTTANGQTYLESAVAFNPTNPGWLEFYTGINIPFPTVVNQYFFWGLGTSPGSPTAAAPLTNACGFEVFTDGKMYAVTYQSGARVVVKDLSIATGNSKQPQDSSVHKYFVFYKGDNIYWCIDSPDLVVASTLTGAPGPDVNILPVKFAAIAGSVAPLSSGSLQINTLTMADTARNNFQIADATFPWRQATVTAGGALWIAPTDGTKTTYSATSTGIAQITTAGAFFVMQGSATKTIKLLKCHVSGVATTATTVDITLARWSAAPSVGTLGTVPTIVPHDSANAAATAVPSIYTVAPTAGTLVGNLRTAKLFCNAPASPKGPDVEWEFGERPGQVPTLRGTTQYFAVLTGALLGAGGSLDVYMEFSEE